MDAVMRCILLARRRGKDRGRGSVIEVVNRAAVSRPRVLSDRLPGDEPAMADADHQHEHFGVRDGVEDPVAALPDTVQFLPRELFTAGRSRISGKAPDPGDDPAAIFQRQGFDFLDGRRLDEQPITCHVAAGL